MVSHCSIYYWKKSMCKWACSNSCSSRVNCKIISVTTYRENVRKAVTPSDPREALWHCACTLTPDLPGHQGSRPLHTIKPGGGREPRCARSLRLEKDQENGKEKEHLSKHTRHGWFQASRPGTHGSTYTPPPAPWAPPSADPLPSTKAATLHVGKASSTPRSLQF